MGLLLLSSSNPVSVENISTLISSSSYQIDKQIYISPVNIDIVSTVDALSNVIYSSMDAVEINSSIASTDIQYYKDSIDISINSIITSTDINYSESQFININSFIISTDTYKVYDVIDTSIISSISIRDYEYRNEHLDIIIYSDVNLSCGYAIENAILINCTINLRDFQSSINKPTMPSHYLCDVCGFDYPENQIMMDSFYRKVCIYDYDE